MNLRGRTIVGISIGMSLLLVTGYALWKTEQLVGFLGRFVNRAPATTTTTTVGHTIVMRTPGGTLEVARIKSYEGLSRSDPGVKVAWGLFDTGTTVSEIDVPALFRYHIEMAKEWPMTCSANACVVHAGPITPTLPPAIYTQEMRKRSSSGWARFNKDQNLAELEKSLTVELEKRASSERNLLAATSAGRRTVAEFAQTWMLNSLPKNSQPVPKVIVLFPGETVQAVSTQD